MEPELWLVDSEQRLEDSEQRLVDFEKRLVNSQQWLVDSEQWLVDSELWLGILNYGFGTWTTASETPDKGCWNPNYEKKA
jgi:hypothetical protein